MVRRDPAQRPRDDQFVVNEYTGFCHRSFCQSARLMGQAWRVVPTVKEARDGGYKECSNCCPFHYFAGVRETGKLHWWGCPSANPKNRNTVPFEPVEEAYREGFRFRGCCAPPGIREYLSRLEQQLDHETSDES